MSSRKTQIENKLIRKVTSVVESLKLSHNSNSLVVAVSGGSDSVALLMILAAVKENLGLTLHVAHLDHGLRGKESEGDRDFVVDLANKLDLPTTCAFRNVNEYKSRHKLSLEDAARNVRYEFFAEVAREQNASAIILGHTYDDQVETILMHLMRGSGIEGMLGMPQLSYWPSKFDAKRTPIVRPLLDVTKKETETYCAANRITPRLDSSNLSRSFTRNRIRKELLPTLETYNPLVKDAITRMSNAVRHQHNYLRNVSMEQFSKLVSCIEDSIVINRKQFCELHPSLQRTLLITSYEKIRGSTKDLKYKHIENLLKIATSTEPKQINLAQGLIVYVRGNEMTFSLKDLAGHRLEIKGEYPISLPGETEMPGWTITTRFVDKFPQDNQNPYKLLISGNLLESPLYVRKRIPGDRFTPSGMCNARKLQDFMVDLKIPRHERDTVPLLVSGNDNIIWVVGYRVSQWAKAKPNTDKGFNIEFLPTGSLEPI